MGRNANTMASNSLDLNTYVQQCEDALTAKVDDEVMMMHPETGEYFGLNPVAAFIWIQLDKPKSVLEICEAVQSEFDVESDRCISDTLSFVEQMINDNLLLASDSQALGS